MTLLSIGKLAKATGLGVETIRYYEREGLLPPPARSAAGYRQYPKVSINRLKFILRSKRLGFTLKEISSLLALSNNAGSKADVKTLTERKLAIVSQKIEDLERIQAALSDLNTRCDGNGSARECPIIHALEYDEEPLE